MSYSEYAHAWAPQSVQSFFLQMRSPGGSNVRLFKDLAQPDCTQEAVLQTAWSTLSLPQSIDKQPTTLRLHDTHKNAFLDGRKPDLTFSAPQHLPSPFSAVVLAELTIDDFSPSKEGELLSCVHRALEVCLHTYTGHAPRSAQPCLPLVDAQLDSSLCVLMCSRSKCFGTRCCRS